MSSSLSSADSQRVAGNETVIAGQKRALELALHGGAIGSVLEVLVKTLEAQSSDNVLASILLLDPDGKHLRQGAAPSLPPEYNAAIDGIEIGPKVGSCGTAAYTAKTVVVADIMTDPLWSEFKELAARHELRACWSTPIFAADRTVLGTFAMYHRVPMVPSDRDRAIVDLLANTAGLVIERERQSRLRAEAEAELQRSAQEQLARIGTMFEHAPAGIAVLRGPQLVFEVANPGYRELVGGRDVVGKPVREALPEIEGQGFFELLDSVLESNKPYIGQSVRAMLQRRKGGPTEECYFDFVYQPVPGPRGTAEAILVVAFEVSSLVKAKLEAETAQRRAEANELELKTLIDNLPELAWTARPDGFIDFYNRRWYEYTGTTFEEMQGWGWEKVHDPSLLPVVVERWKHSLATGEPFEMEFTLRGADGIPRWFLTRVSPSRAASGEIVRWVGTNTNIDDIKAAQALTSAMTEQSQDVQRMLLELRAAKEKAEQRLAELEQK